MKFKTKAMAELFEAIFDDSKAFAALDKLQAELIKSGEVGAASAEEIGKAFELAKGFVEGFQEEMKVAAKDVAEHSKKVQQAQKDNATWGNSIKQLVGNFTVGGQSLNQWAQQIKGFAGIIQEGTKATEGATLATRIFSTALKATGIGLIIAAVAALIGYFTRFQSGVDKVNRVLAATGAVFDKLIAGAVNFGTALGKVFQGDFTGALASAKKGIDDVTVGLVDAAVGAYELEAAFQSLRDTTIRASVETARQRAEMEKQKAIADDITLSFGKRVEAQKKAGALEVQIANTAFDLAKRDLALKQQKLDSNEENAQFIKDEAAANVAYFNAKAERDKAQLEAEKALRELRKDASEQRKKQIEDEQKALEALDKELQKLRIAALGEGLDAELAKVNQKFDELAKEAEAGIKKFNEIAAKRGLTPEELAKQKEFAELEKTIEEQRLGALLDVLTEFNEKDNAIAKEQEERKKALAEKDLERAIKSIEAEKKLRDEQINLSEQQNEKFLLELKGRGAKEEEINKAKENLDKFIQAARLNNELEFQQNLLSLTDAGNTEQIAQIEATIATIKAKIANLQVEDPKKKPQNIFELLGITDKDAQGAIKEGVKLVIDGINQISEARVKAAEERVAAIDKEIEAEKDQLDKEIELAKAGLANNVDTEKKRLAELKAQRDAALKEEAKARRAAIILDSVQQLSSLITASANIFKSLSGLPFGLGVPVAIGVIAAMFGAFVAAKAKALKAADVPKFREGGKLPGRRHEQGGTPIIDRSGYQIAEGEEGEYLLPVGPSKEHEPFLDRMRKGEFRGVNLDALIPYKSKYVNPTSEAVARIKDIEQRRAELTDARHWAAMKAAYSQGAERIVSAIEAIPEITPLHSYRRRVKRGNLTEVVTVNKAE